MKEMAEFRVDARFASMLFADSEGKRLGDSVRLVKLESNDPRFAEVGRLQQELRANGGSPFFYGWRLWRKYTRQEILNAELFSVRVTRVFAPAGEECGTKYDESSSCPSCGSGARQLGPLHLTGKRIPSGKDFAKTFAGEIVISRRAAEVFKRHGVVGAGIGPVRTKRSSQEPSSDWFQLSAQVHVAEIVPPTRVGIHPFDDDLKGECRCQLGDLMGLNLLSEVWVARSTYPDLDIVSSREFIGVRRGLLRPVPVILINQTVWHMIESEGLTGIHVEVAHLI